MNRVRKILERVRDTLADPEANTWKNGRLLRSLSECQDKIARETLCLRYSATVEMCDGYHTYYLDSSAVEPLGGTPFAISSIINQLGDACTFATAAHMDNVEKGWRGLTGPTVTKIVYDRKRPMLFRVFPIPTSSDMPAGSELNEVDEPITDAATVVSPIITESSFLITEELTPVKLLVEFYHTPPDITTVNDTNLLISTHFDTAIKHYISGMVLRDDKDSQNRSFGLEELKLFQQSFDIAKAALDSDYIDKTKQIYAEVGYEKAI